MTGTYTYGWDFIGFSRSINCLSFSPDGTQLAAGDDAGSVLVLDYMRREMLLRFESSVPVTAIVWHPRRPALFAGYGDGGLVLLDTSVAANGGMTASKVCSYPSRFKLNSSCSLQTIPVPNRMHPLGAQDIVEALAFDPTKNCVAVALQSCVILCYISDTGESYLHLILHSIYIHLHRQAHGI